MKLPIYLDYNATTPVALEVAAAIRPWLEEQFGNPSSSHLYGQRAKQAVAQARSHVAALIGAALHEGRISPEDFRRWNAPYSHPTASVLEPAR